MHRIGGVIFISLVALATIWAYNHFAPNSTVGSLGVKAAS